MTGTVVYWDRRLGRYGESKPVRAGDPGGRGGVVPLQVDTAMVAANAGGSALVVLVALHAAGIEAGRVVPIPDCRLWGLSARQAADGVARLESAGVIETERAPGKRVRAGLARLKTNVDGHSGHERGLTNSGVAGDD